MKRFLAIIFSLTLVVGLLAGCGSGSGQEVKLRLGHDQPESHPFHKASVFLAKKVAEKSGNKIKIDVFPSAQLGNEVAMLESVRNGSLDMSIAAAPNAAAIVPELGLFSVSYLFKDQAHFTKAIKDDQMNKRLRELVASKKAGLGLQSVFTAGLRHVYANKELKSFDDFKGIKIRVMASPVEARVWKTIGTLPTSMPFGELYTALQTGVVNAGENAPVAYTGSKHNEVAPNFHLTGHQWLLAMLFMSDKTAEKLSADQKKIITEAALEMAEYEVKTNVEDDDKLIAEMPSKYKAKVVPVDKAAFQKALAPLQDEVAKEFKMDDVLKRVRDLGK